MMPSLKRALWDLPSRAIGRLSSSTISRIPTSEKECYLTFDDGPSRYTPLLLDTLDKWNAKATFFLVGANLISRESEARDIVARHHAVGNHSFSHPRPWSTSSTPLQEDYRRCEDALSRISPTRSKLLRPPYGQWLPATSRWCNSNSISLVLWDVLSGDFSAAAENKEIMQACISRVQPGSIVVFHDSPGFLRDVTIPVLENLLERLTIEGWIFKSL